MVFRIAVVEDDSFERERLKKYLNTFEKREGDSFIVKEFSNGKTFADEFCPDFDIVFLDVGLPGLNGISVAKEIRKKDSGVTIVFITSMKEYAIEGYSVQAYDYIVKPLDYGSFKMKFDRLYRKVARSKSDDYITVTLNKAPKKIIIKDIIYVEIVKHNLWFHCFNEEFSLRGSMDEIYLTLSGNGFERCNSCYLVNLRYVDEIKPASVVVAGNELSVSRGKRQNFLLSYARFLGGNKC